MISLFTCIMLAQADGGHDFTVSDAGTVQAGVVSTKLTNSTQSTLYDTCPAAPPAQVIFHQEEDGGFNNKWRLLPPERVSRIACIMETCEADRSRREKAMSEAPPPLSWGAAISIAVTSVTFGYGFSKLTGK